jgi:magnesium chelatase subunit D
LPHRRRRNPFDAPGLDEDLLDQILGDEELPPEPPEGSETSGPDGSASADGQADTNSTDVSESREHPEMEAPAEGPGPEPGDDDPRANQDAPPPQPELGLDSTVGAGTAYRPKLLKVQGLGEGAAGRRSRAIASSGRRVGARRPDGAHGSLDLVETLLAAAGKQPTRERVGTRVALRSEDIRTAVREGREANLVLFCVDASGSMAARKRMTQVKTAILSLLLDAYRRRDKVGLVTFRGADAQVALPPTNSVDIAATRLDELPAGGRTPLAEGLLEAARVLLRERLRDPRLRPLLVVVTDGRATGGKDAVARSQQAAEYVASLGVTTVVVDGENGPMRLGLAMRLAELLGAEHLPVADVSAEALSATVHIHTRPLNGAA